MPAQDWHSTSQGDGAGQLQTLPTETSPAEGLREMHFSHGLIGRPELEPSFGGILEKPPAFVPSSCPLGILCLQRCHC